MRSLKSSIGNLQSSMLSLLLAAGMLAALAPRAEAVSATGGTVTNYSLDGTNWTAHIFTTVGTTSLTVQAGGNCEVLVVGGGGGGGMHVGGGGGAGGVIYATSYTLTAATNYVIYVGDGGLGSTNNAYLDPGSNGFASVFDSNNVSGKITADGGGGGAGYAVSRWSGTTNGSAGGSGGGGGIHHAVYPNKGGPATIGSWPGGVGATGYGNAGGACYGTFSSPYGGGGGGGAGHTGYDSTGIGANGGDGLYFAAFSNLVPSTASTANNGWFGGGGGAGSYTTGGSGGLGGGGAGKGGTTKLNGDPGVANTGGGGGGSDGYISGSDYSYSGGKGGSGIVIVRYYVNTIIVGPTSNGFPNTYVNTTSTWFYTISGSSLTNNLTVSVPSPSVFTISSNNVDYGSELVLTTNAVGDVPLTNIWVRFIPTSAVFFSEFITNSSPGAYTKTVQVTGRGLPANTPVLTVTPSAFGFGNVITNKTSTNMFTVTGFDLTNSVTVSAPPECFWLSTNGADFTQSPLVLATNGSGGTYLTNIYVRFTPTAGQAYGGSITNSTTGAIENQTVSLTGTGVVQTLVVSPTTLASFGNVVTNTTSATTNYTVSGSNLEDNVTVTAPSASFAVSTNSSTGFGQSCTVLVANASALSGATLISTPVYVRFTPVVPGPLSGSITNSSAGAANGLVGVSGTGVVQTLYVSGGTLDFGNVFTGTISWVSLSYTVSGSNLTANVTVTPPADFKVSASSVSGFGTSLTLTQSGGTLAATNVYVRFVPTLVQSYAGASITNSSAGAANALQGVSGTGVVYESKMSTGGDSIYIRTVSGTNYYVHVFTTNGTFTPKQGLTVEYLIVGGGGGGNAGRFQAYMGGGGGGGQVTSGVSTVTAIGYPVVVGAGGGYYAADNGSGTNGASSSFNSITASGGFGAPGGDTLIGNGGASGSGKSGGARTTHCAGGGGGDSQNGYDSGNSTTGGNGGDGSTSSISGASSAYGGGGGAYGGRNGTGGSGGGGNIGSAGTPNTGGGGGGNSTSGGGGSGIVIIRYVIPLPKGTVFMMR